jgi:hypothetical protein
MIWQKAVLATGLLLTSMKKQGQVQIQLLKKIQADKEYHASVERKAWCAITSCTICAANISDDEKRTFAEHLN